MTTPIPWFPLLLYTTASVLAYLLGLHLARTLQPPFTKTLTALTVALLLLNALALADHPLWINLLPLENVWLYSNPALPAAAFLIALTAKLLPIRWQHTLLALILLPLALHRALDPLYGQRPTLSPPRWSNETFRQSTPSTCAPAAAVSALSAIGLHTDEKTLSQAAFSTTAGTRNLCLYRALRQATQNTNIQITAYRGPAETLPTPAIIVLAPKNVGAGTTIGDLLPIGGRHAIAILRREETTFIVADPYAGTQSWPPAQLEKLWTGTAFILSRPLP